MRKDMRRELLKGELRRKKELLSGMFRYGTEKLINVHVVVDKIKFLESEISS